MTKDIHDLDSSYHFFKEILIITHFKFNYDPRISFNSTVDILYHGHIFPMFITIFNHTIYFVF